MNNGNITLATIYEDVEALKARVAALESIYSDSGWIDLPLLNGALPHTTAQRPQYRKIGNHIYVRGVIVNVTTFPTMVAQLPEGFRPNQRIIYFMASNGANVARLEIETNGAINIVHYGNNIANSGTHYSLGTLGFLTD